MAETGKVEWTEKHGGGDFALRASCSFPLAAYKTEEIKSQRKNQANPQFI